MIIAIIIVGLAAGAYFFFKKKSNKVNTSTPANPANVASNSPEGVSGN